MLDHAIKSQLKTYFERLTAPVELSANLDNSETSANMRELLAEVVELSSLIKITGKEGGLLNPSFSLGPSGSSQRVTFAGMPLGHEFNSFVLALLQAGGVTPKQPEQTLEQVRALKGPLHFETFYSQSCQNCPEVVQALNLMALLNADISHTAFDGAQFPGEVEARNILAVPSVFLNGKPFAQGRMALEEILDKLGQNKPASRLKPAADNESFDVLVVGGGPAGVASAIYAARKGIRTGVAGERFGGQVQDTMGIENLISIPHTEGPRLVAKLAEHVSEYGIDVMNGLTARKLIPATAPGALTEVEFTDGTRLKARSVVIATGARWRQLNVPGEDLYRNKGVAYCPHCDGPLFKGKRVAVIGGGNSGVEAAIDLAGIVAHVTLIEFDDRLRADAVLQRKLLSLQNVSVITSAQTTEIHGNGNRVIGLSYQSRSTGEVPRVDLDGVFVQIGLLPNTEWLKGAISLNGRGEIEVDDRGATSTPGVFAAGDATTVPFKQIVIAMGDGAKAALSAFDYLIRLQPESVAAAA